MSYQTNIKMTNGQRRSASFLSMEPVIQWLIRIEHDEPDQIARIVINLRKDEANPLFRDPAMEPPKNSP